VGAAAAKPNLDICNACGKLFARAYVKLCKECVVNEEHRFMLVREFLRDNQGTSIAEIAEATGLSRGEVARYYSEGRLVDVDPGSGITQTACTCETEGRRCAFCRRNLAEKFDQLRSNMGRADSQPASDDTTRGKRGSWSGGQGGSWSRGASDAGSADDDDRVRYVRRDRRLGDS
jgi:hypothetical protein